MLLPILGIVSATAHNYTRRACLSQHTILIRPQACDSCPTQKQQYDSTLIHASNFKRTRQHHAISEKVRLAVRVGHPVPSHCVPNLFQRTIDCARAIRNHRANAGGGGRCEACSFTLLRCGLIVTPSASSRMSGKSLIASGRKCRAPQRARGEARCVSIRFALLSCSVWSRLR